MQYGECAWNDIRHFTSKVIVVPLGSLEQHGHHLPLLTDSLIGGEIVRRAEAALADEALFLPMLWLGASHHHLGHPGTVSLNNNLYVSVIEDVLESLIQAGFRRIFLLNSHGGNEVPGSQAALNVQLRHHASKPDLWIAFATWFGMAAPQIAEIESLEQKFVTHACELETSMILMLRPQLVKLDAARGAIIPFESDFYAPDVRRSSRVYVPRSFSQISETGALGYPELASAEKGEALFEMATREVVAFIREFAHWQPFAPGQVGISQD